MTERKSLIILSKAIGLFFPLITFRWTISNYSFTLYMLIMTFTAVYLLIVKNRKVQINRSDGYVYLFTCVVLASILYSSSASYGLSRFIKLALVVTLYFIYRSALKYRPILIETIMKYSTYGLTLMLLYLAYVYLVKFNVSYIGVITSYPTRGSKNSLSFVVAIVFGFLISDFIVSLRMGNKILIKSILLSINIILSLAIQSRALFLVIIFYLIFLFSNVIGKKKMLKSAIWFVLVFSVIILILPNDLVTNVNDRFNTLGFLFKDEVVVENYSIATRTDLLSKGMNIFMENPLFGSGLGSFMSYGDVVTHLSHNDYLLVLSEQGLVGILVFLMLIFSHVFQAYINMKSNSNFINIGLFLSICGVSIYFLFINAYDNILFWSLLAFINAVTLSGKKMETFNTDCFYSKISYLRVEKNNLH